MIDRKAIIKQKGFAVNMATEENKPSNPPIDFSKIKIGTKVLDDAILEFGELKTVNPSLSDKATILDALDRRDVFKLREISNFFYRVSGIYARLCRYMAYLYKYDWFITPYIVSESMKAKESNDKITKTFHLIQLRQGMMPLEKLTR